MATFWVENGWLYAKNLTPGSIQDSVAKWETLRGLCLAGRLVHDGSCNTCALCQKYDDCTGCPVHEATGLFDCKDTPYGDYHDALEQRDIAMALSAAEDEIAFLESL